MPTISRKNSHANTPFLIGFEFECRVAEEFYDDFCMDLRHFGIINVGYDNSIRSKNGYHSMEFRTEAMEYNKGILLLEEFLSYLYLYTQAGLFETDQSCGFHVNLSAPELAKSEVHLKYFFCKFAQLFKEHDVLKTYSRYRNDYCNPFMGSHNRTFKRAVRRFYDLYDGQSDYAVTDKYRAVTLRSMNNGRIELRCLGNKNYHTRFDEAKKTLDHAKCCLDSAYKFAGIKHKFEPLHTVIGAENEQDAIRRAITTI